MQAQKTERNGFTGPFLVLGILPSWPEELERRKDFTGPHSQLSALFPIKAIQPQQPVVVEQTSARRAPEARFKQWEKAVPPIGGKNSVLVLSRRMSPLFLERLERAVKALSRPRTVRQLVRETGASSPTVYAMLELLRRRGFPLVVDDRGRAKTYCLVPQRAPHARA